MHWISDLPTSIVERRPDTPPPLRRTPYLHRRRGGLSNDPDRRVIECDGYAAGDKD